MSSLEEVEESPSPTLDTTVLGKLIADAKEITNAEGKYTAESYATLQSAIEEAQSTIKTAKTNEELATASSKLQQALEGIVEAQVDRNINSNSEQEREENKNNRNVESKGDKDSKGNQILPRTATDQYTILLGGIVLLLMGGGTIPI